jgi:hypothetical protein
MDNFVLHREDSMFSATDAFVFNQAHERRAGSDQNVARSSVLLSPESTQATRRRELLMCLGQCIDLKVFNCANREVLTGV